MQYKITEDTQSEFMVLMLKFWLVQKVNYMYLHFTILRWLHRTWYTCSSILYIHVSTLNDFTMTAQTLISRKRNNNSVKVYKLLLGIRLFWWKKIKCQSEIRWPPSWNFHCSNQHLHINTIILSGGKVGFCQWQNCTPNGLNT